MLYWQPIHQARWRSFLAGLGDALDGRDMVVAAPALEQEAVVPIAVIEPIAAKLEPVSTIPAPDPAALAPVADLIPPVPEILSEILSEIVPEILAESLPGAELQTRLEPAPLSPSSSAPASTGIDDAAITPPRQATITPASPSAASGLGSASAFFSALGWSGGSARFSPASTGTQTAARFSASAATTQGEPERAAVSTESPVTQLRKKAASFFRNLPWSGSSHYGETITSIHVTAIRDDSGLDPRTAAFPGDNPLLTGMLSAARTSDRMAARPSRPTHARGFFSSLPWAHT